MNELKKQTGNLFEADREERITVELQGLCWSDINIIVLCAHADVCCECEAFPTSKYPRKRAHTLCENEN